MSEQTGVEDTDETLETDDDELDGEEVREPTLAEKAMEALRLSRERDNTMDKTIPGGRYVSSDGKLKNAHGQLIDDDGTVLDGTLAPPPPIRE